jgi:hypothetical protein
MKLIAVKMSGLLGSLLLVASSSSLAEETTVLDWFAAQTSIESRSYELVPVTSYEACTQAGDISIAEKDGFLTVFFSAGVMTQGIGRKVYISKGEIGPGCTLTVATSDIPQGLSILTTRSCGESSSSVERQRLLKLDQGFRIVNETKIADGEWKLRTSCAYRPKTEKE